MSDILYTMLRQPVVAQLPLGAQPREVLQLIAHAAICGSAQAAPLDFLTAGETPASPLPAITSDCSILSPPTRIALPHGSCVC
jgi:hypothetical protein